MRHHPHVTIRHNVANQSSRNGLTPHLIVLHDTEGGNIPHSNRDLAGLGDWFNNPKAQASAHVGVDQDGNSGRYVDDQAKAWACVAYNSLSLNIEQIGHATDDWTAKAMREELEETARWLAIWNHRHGIPLTRIRDPRKAGVLQHRDLGLPGGGHHDVSASYPVAYVLRRARFHRDHL